MNNQALIEKLQTLLKDVEKGASDDVLKLNCNVHIELKGPDGKVKDTRDLHNVICTAGKNKLLAISGQKYINDYAYICIGTGSTGEVIGNTALGAEVARALGTTSNPTAASWQVTYTFPAGTGTGAITEEALDYQNTASAAILNRLTFAAVNKGAADSLQITVTLS